MSEEEKMLRKWIQNHKQLISEAPDEKQRDYITMMWLGYLNGLRMSNAITWAKYNNCMTSCSGLQPEWRRRNDTHKMEKALNSTAIG